MVAYPHMYPIGVPQMASTQFDPHMSPHLHQQQLHHHRQQQQQQYQHQQQQQRVKKKFNASSVKAFVPSKQPSQNESKSEVQPQQPQQNSILADGSAPSTPSSDNSSLTITRTSTSVSESTQESGPASTIQNTPATSKDSSDNLHSTETTSVTGEGAAKQDTEENGVDSTSRRNDHGFYFDCSIQNNNANKTPIIFGDDAAVFLKRAFDYLELKKRQKPTEETHSEADEEDVDIVEQVKEQTPEVDFSEVEAQPHTPFQQTSSRPSFNWAAVASNAAKKVVPQTPTPSTSSPASPQVQIQPKREERLIPVLPNVMEPLGVVVLRFMFDDAFSKYIDSVKLPKIVPRGLVNTGNICFMSSIMQLLLYCVPFYKTLNVIAKKTMHTLMTSNSKSPLFDATVDFYNNFNVNLDDINSLSNSNTQRSQHDREATPQREFGESFTPVEFFKAISKSSRFQHLKWGQQEDAEEFLGFLLDGLHEEFTSNVKSLTDDEIKQFTKTLDESSRQKVLMNLRKFHVGEFNSSESSGKNDGNVDDHYDDDDDDDVDADDDDNINAYDHNDEFNGGEWQEVGSEKKKKRFTAKRTVEVKPSPIRRIFGGSFRSVLTIPKNKEAQSITLDPFQQVQLDISDPDIKTLEDAFVQISHVEEIPMKTSKGVEVVAKKQTFVDQLPEVLIIHLKRFSFESSGRVEKLKKKIQYPHLFQIPTKSLSPRTRKFNPDGFQYKLTGVVYHHGMGSNGGHYTVDVLRSVEGEWVRIDDVTIHNLKPDDVLVKGDEEDVKTAYILMYQKV